MKAIKAERSKNIKSTYDEITKSELGCTYIATFSTESSKSAILTAARGYRSEEFPDGIDSDISKYLSSLIPSDRGFVRTLSQVINGDEEKGFKPITTFINEIAQYPGLLEIAQGIEGLISRRGIHASGIIMFDEDPYERCCFMKAPNGNITTQFDLHDAEYAGNVKYDLNEIIQQILYTGVC
jgi:DNA polymerase-3 subunit alpha